ncbi:MAG: 2-oxoacid:ferredoxin oxidoreductase subunit gamma [Clostridiales bacterium]|nr:2-oxoacid:ferredoxin oxidoreductase subunit gamma [Clostridiales bacterium]
MGQVEIIIAGFGGQGIQAAGMLIAYAGMIENKYVSWLPSYGPEMRGGTSNCHVIVSDEVVGSPIINNTTALLVMNGPSLEKFESNVVPGGFIITDSSIISQKVKRTDIDVYEIPATKMANEMGNAAFSNIIMLGKLLAKTGVISVESFEKALKKVLPEKKHYLIPEEMLALKAGMDL